MKEDMNEELIMKLMEDSLKDTINKCIVASDKMSMVPNDRFARCTEFLLKAKSELM